jgi:hypothetical protein
MADNLTLRDGNGQPFTLRTKDLSGAGLHAYFSMVVTAIPTPVGTAQTVALSTTVDTTLVVPAGGTHAQLTVDSGAGDMRYWENGTSPSATAGWDVPSGNAAELTNLANVKMRSTSGAPNVQYACRRYDQ